jgi:hypothetical protein
MDMEGKKYLDEIHHFPGKWEMPSLCGLMIQKKVYGALIILTELYEENPGSSVTGMVEQVATGLVENYRLDPHGAKFIVHNPERSSRYEFFAETFYRAEMQWDGKKYFAVEWVRLEAEEISHLLQDCH